MSEAYNSPSAILLSLPLNYVYAQTFTPLWSHTIELLRFWIQPSLLPSVVKVSVQYLKPDGTPDGVDLIAFERRFWNIAPVRLSELLQERTPAIRLVEGTQYALLLQTIHGVPGFTPSSLYSPPPSGYTRGKLIRSVDQGNTWDTTDRGDLCFAEYGDPPRAPTPYIEPFDHFAITDITQTNYYVNSCTRVATANPCTLRCFVTNEVPILIRTYRTTRGVSILCLDHYVIKNWRSYPQLEDTDSLYHTFFLKGLKAGKSYWFCFLGKANYLDDKSTGPIFHRIHHDAPPFTTIRRPDAPGDRCRIDWQVGAPCPNHYLNINEATPDEDDTFVSPRYIAIGWQRDLYNIPDLLPSDDGPIEQVHLTFRIRYQGGYSYASKARIVLKTHGTEYQSEVFSYFTPSYQNFHWHSHYNPFTLQDWTPGEINALQIGCNLYRYTGVGWGTRVHCTQVYCKIIHKCEAKN